MRASHVAPTNGVWLFAGKDKAEKQAIRRRKTKVEKKRQAKPISAVLPAVPSEQQPQMSARKNGKPAEKKKSSGVHVVLAPEAMALRPMTIEEAVKEAESGDRQVLVFRDLAGDVKVLHCAGDGLVRLTEVS